MSRRGSDRPTIFISYAWESAQHKSWVSDFATKLKRGGFNVILDQWHLRLGEQIAEFIDTAIRDADFVLVVCTPAYKQRSEERRGGVGYEQDILSAGRLVRRTKKTIPILRSGTWDQCVPSWLEGTFGEDLRGEPYPDDNYRHLKANLYQLYRERLSRSSNKRRS